MKTKTYKSIDTWTNAMRKDINKTLWHDWFKIGGHWYTCEEYDESGRYMRYTSVTAWQHIDIDTSNRYSKTWLSDLKVTEYPIESLRFDISYYLDIEDIKKLSYKQLEKINHNLYKNEMYSQCKSLLEIILKTIK